MRKLSKEFTSAFFCEKSQKNPKKNLEILSEFSGKNQPELEGKVVHTPEKPSILLGESVEFEQ